MGWTVLYIAFGVVALWLLGEVLLQYKARLRWRLVAFAGFGGVVVGVAVLSSIPVIALGAMTFAVGQTFVTLSYRRGFSTGWALGGRPGSSRRRREGGSMEPLPPVDADPVLEVSGLEVSGAETYQPPEAYQPQPLDDDTGGYGVYDRGDQIGTAPGGYPDQGYGQGPGAFQDQGGYQDQTQAGGYGDQQGYPAYADAYGNGNGYDHGYDNGQYAATASYDAYGDGMQGYDGVSGYDGVNEYDPAHGYAPQPGYPPEPPAYAPAPGAAAHSSDGYGTQYVTDGQYAPQDGYYPESPYPDGGYQQTPPGGVWVPQQRDATNAPPPPPEAPPYPYQNGYGDGGYDPAFQGNGYDAAANGYDPAANGYDNSGYDSNGYGYDMQGGNDYYYGDQRGY